VKAKPAPQTVPKEKSPPPPAIDALVLGEHPSAYLAALLLHAGDKGKGLRVVHATIPDQNEPDHLVLINPAFFALHPALESIRKRVEMVTLYGLQFISDDPAVRSEHRSKSAMAYVASSRAVRAEMARVAEQAGVECLTPKALEIRRVDETGLDVSCGKNVLRATSLVLGGLLPAAQRRVLGMPDAWGPDVVHRYTYVKLGGQKKWADVAARPVAPMSLNLMETLCWGWLLPGPKYCQIAVAQPVETLAKLPAATLLAHWARVLHAAGVLMRDEVPLDHAEHLDLPAAGALAHEGVANRTLLVGPAGGFYGQSTEDVYPNGWSAVFAADVLRRALKEPHLQDALNPYRSKWRTSLGQYLRGSQQDFRFLLPLVYRNEVMTARLTESILQGKAVVR
jgi:hypothetical protein